MADQVPAAPGRARLAGRVAELAVKPRLELGVLGDELALGPGEPAHPAPVEGEVVGAQVLDDGGAVVEQPQPLSAWAR